ncbi:MAG: tRNA (adenosine(37)-N6)-threonylcarbamoyltransferase complex dimerization subunit type 1 TsaB [Candidatus Omnitrophota bacterium]
MKIFGIDTTSKFLCVGAYDNGRIYDYNLQAGVRHSSLLVPAIKRITGALGWDLDDIDYFACGIGPGSFTGIRVGMATIKALAWSLRKPLVGVSSLEIIARNFKIKEGTIIPVIDAKRNLVYASAFRIRGESLSRVMPYMLLGVGELCKKFKGNVFVLGDALTKYRMQITRDMPKAVILDADYWYPQGHNIIRSALNNIKDRKIDTAYSIKPVYLYPKECQIRENIKPRRKR